MMTLVTRSTTTMKVAMDPHIHASTQWATVIICALRLMVFQESSRDFMKLALTILNLLKVIPLRMMTEQ